MQTSPRVQTKTARANVAFVQLLQRINSETAQQLRIEVGRFLRQYATGERDIADLIHAHRVHEEGEVGFATMDLGNGFAGVAQIANVSLGSNGFLADAENALEKQFVKLNDVQ